MRAWAVDPAAQELARRGRGPVVVVVVEVELSSTALRWIGISAATALESTSRTNITKIKRRAAI